MNLWMKKMKSIRELKDTYRTGRDNIGKDFFSPCLESCIEYKRAAGYFSSSALVSWAAGLPRIISDSSVKLRLIISPKLSENDLAILHDVARVPEAVDMAQNVIDDYLIRAIEYSESVNDITLRLDLFGWLMKSGRLILRLAVVNPGNGDSLYHEKFGIFQFPAGDKVSFIGSANESQQAYERNGELIIVFKSWIDGDSRRIDDLDKEFDEAWEGKIPGLTLYSPSASVLDRIANLSVRTLPGFSKDQDAKRPPDRKSVV